MTNLPDWVVVLQALLPIAIALAVGVIAFLQWRTAHQKVVLDVFDRRLSVFDDTMKFRQEVSHQGFKIDMETVVAFHTVRRRARFLFGDDVNAVLQKWHEHLIEFSTSITMIELDEDARQEHAPKATAAYKASAGLQHQINEVFIPYMRMDQKRVRTPFEWMRDRNELRKSYGDNHQR